MNDCWTQNGVLSQDDIDGIRFVWSRICGSGITCPDGYVGGQVLMNGQFRYTGFWNETHCVPGNNPRPGTCEDTNPNCAGWVSSGECERNPNYMLTGCCMSCKRGSGPGLAIKDVLGTYQRTPVLNNWHVGRIEQTAQGLQWINNAGYSWTLAADLGHSRLLTQSDCPYRNSPGGSEFTLVTSNGRVAAFRFHNEQYLLQ